ncbi:putative glyoxalase superfamily metalloenzyme YdcJ [Sphingobium fontiphilum]|uniref:2-oxoadipate dioxygenase/decarboxylase n=1 Tax=Sphingobium fontiphilum TaxID=944425 RepID=A0A7W6DH37_9SPHN|nr:VOC family protein [Sphingobium fontiphilum]MBB3980520.1 putative glyoxalase superfamily metalloenzyme YdcJ [Sphingobium fontiphilum]
MTDPISSTAIRARFAAAMSDMYRQEVPLYGDLLDIVSRVNAAVLAAEPALRAALEEAGELARLDAERHGAIRVGTAQELSALRRVFAVMGMAPVGYYDLSVAGVPVHSTAFRPIDSEALRANPFRVFTSLLRLDLIADTDLRAQAASILAGRRILSDRAMELVALHEERGGLSDAQASEFVDEVLDTFRWHARAIVDRTSYDRLNAAHRLIADIVSFRGPHINHLTPRTLDIDAAQQAMHDRGMAAKDVVEGPPRRAVPILLRQTSFKALDESIGFVDDLGQTTGSHTARFGEIEQRGVALTPAGRALYDACLDRARGAQGSQGADYMDRLAAAFSAMPDDIVALRRDGLAYFRYSATPTGVGALAGEAGDGADVEAWIDAGWIRADPITYEDFLPVSAAGIFQSNLEGREQAAYAAHSAQAQFEQALGAPVADPFALYAAEEAASRAAAIAALRGA